MNIKTEHKIGFRTTTRLMVDYARNLALNICVDEDYDYLIFLDDDNPPLYSDFIDMLVNN
jgi:hypothetical protein